MKKKKPNEELKKQAGNKMKIGDKVKINENLQSYIGKYVEGILVIKEMVEFAGKEYLITKKYEAYNAFYLDTELKYLFPGSLLELINNFNSDNVAKKQMGLTEKFLSSLKKEPEKSWRKAGITNGDDIPTDEGMKLICTVLLQENEEIRKEMTKIAKDILDDEKKD